MKASNYNKLPIGTAAGQGSLRSEMLLPTQETVSDKLTLSSDYHRMDKEIAVLPTKIDYIEKNISLMQADISTIKTNMNSIENSIFEVSARLGSHISHLTGILKGKNLSLTNIICVAVGILGIAVAILAIVVK